MVDGSGVPHQSDLLYGRLMWLIRIRWFALAGVFVLVAVFSYLGIISELTPPLTTLSVLVVLNLFYFLTLKHKTFFERLGIKVQCLCQNLTDILGILVVIHFTGGLTNPFIFLLVAPIIVAGIFFQPRWTYLLAFLALGLSAVLGLLETGGTLAIHPLSIFKESDDPNILHEWMSIILITLGILLFCSAFLACQIVSTLRKREWHLAHSQAMMLLKSHGQATAAEQRREALSGLARGVDRQIKDPLGIIRARVDVLRYDLEDSGHTDGNFIEDLDVIAEKVGQIDRSLKKISTLWGQDSGERASIDLAGLVKEVIGERWENLQERGIRIRLAMAPGLPLIEGGRKELMFLFESILQNAIEALEKRKKGKILVQLRTVQGKPEQILVRIRDNGPGLSADVQKRLFDPFYSTRSDDRGTGLAMAYLIVRNHNGSIRVRSIPPHGTSVLVLLPLTQSLSKY